MDVVEVEFGLHRREAETYSVELRVTLPDSDAEPRVTARFPVAKIDFDALRREKFDADAHGRLLTDCLFADAEVRSAFERARAVAQAKDAALRLRLLVGSRAPELHGLYWEALRDPADGGAPLFTGERVLFSRYLTSADWRPVRRRPRDELRALVAIANPSDLSTYQPGGRPLTPIDVPAELARAKAGLQGIRCEELAAPGSATLDGLVAALMKGCDILYLVCHGAVIAGEPWLWLEGDDGKSQRVSGSDLVQRIQELRSLPALIVLASCQSAAAGDGEPRSTEGGVLAALGPRLAEAGVPAVVAMQADVAMATAADFMPVLFRELRRDGQVDRAVAMARGAVRARPDWYVPVLFMRLRGGSLWYARGFEDKNKGESGLKNWEAVLSQIETRRLTPILGPGLTDSLLGSRRDVAQRWAETFRFPMAPHDRDDLPQVAQYVATRQRASAFPQNELIKYLREVLVARYGRDLAAGFRDKADDEVPAAHLSRLISEIGRQRRQGDPNDPFAVLARLQLPIYVTTSQSDLITDALREAGKDPHVDFCRWNDDVLDVPAIEPDFRPDPARPLVYHLFGRLTQPESLVLTEDDYFDFLIGMKKNKDLIPGVVKRALADTGLLFLGFHLDDWNFRIMFRAIMDQEGGRGRRGRYAHVAAQIDPEEGRIIELLGARDYLESYFTDSAISIYWGSPDDFIADLAARRTPKAAAA